MEYGRLIFKMRTGSHLYGTNIPTSDEDFVGIFLPDAQYLLGLKDCDEVDLSVKNKDALGKNTKDAVDIKYYNYRKFVKLALGNNPNILEMLFCNDENILYKDEYAERLLANRSRFLYKGLVGKFIGYASSQKHKMMIKLENYENLYDAKEVMRGLNDKLLVAEFKELWDHNRFKYDTNHVRMGDLHIPMNDPIKRAKKRIEERLGKVTSRKELFTKYGYDVKFGMHLIRLLLEGKELLETGELVFPLKKRDLLLDIRNGKYDKEQVFEMATALETEIDIAKENSKLPNKPRFDEINNFLIEEMKRWLK